MLTHVDLGYGNALSGHWKFLFEIALFKPYGTTPRSLAPPLPNPHLQQLLHSVTTRYFRLLGDLWEPSFSLILGFSPSRLQVACIILSCCTSLFISCMSDSWRKVPFHGSIFLWMREIETMLHTHAVSLCDPHTHHPCAHITVPVFQVKESPKANLFPGILCDPQRVNEFPLAEAVGNCSQPLFPHS